MQLTPREKDFLAVFGFLAVLFILALSRIETFTGWQDEMEIADKALAIRYGAKLYRDPLFFLPSVSIPGMVVYYTGALTTYIAVPFLYLMGPSLVSLRFGFVLLAAAGLTAIYYCIRMWLGRAAAFTATVLMTISPAFFHAVTTSGESEEAIVIYFFWIGTALLIYAAQKQGRRHYIWLAGFLWGLAVYTKLLMLGYLLGIGCIWIASDKRDKHWFSRTLFISWPNFAAFCLAFVLGALPAINVFFINKGNAETNSIDGLAALVIQILSNTEGYNPIYRLITRINDLYFFFADTLFFEQPAHKQLFLITTSLLLLCHISAVIYAVTSRNPDKKRFKTLALNMIILYFFVFLTLCFVPKTFSRIHLISLFPLIQLAQILTLAILLKIKSATLKYCAVTFFSCLLVAHTATNIQENIKYFNLCRFQSIPHEAVHMQPFSYKSFSYIRNNNLSPLFIADSDWVEHLSFMITTWIMAPAHKYNPELMRSKTRPASWPAQSDNCNFYLLIRSPSEHPFQDLPSENKPEIIHMATFRCWDNSFRHIYNIIVKNRKQSGYISDFFPKITRIYNIPDNDLI